MLTIIAEIKIKPGQDYLNHVMNIFKQITPTVLAEDGCSAYELLLNHDANVPYQNKFEDTIVMLEKWQSMEHLNAHLVTPHMQVYQNAVKDIVIGTTIRILENGF